jgi:WD40 repeat protein
VDKRTQLPDIVYSPNSDLLATVDGQGELTLWAVKTGKEWARFQVSKVAGVSRWRPNFAFSPDGQALAFVNRNETAVILWDLAENRERALLPGGSSPVLFSRDSQILATAYSQSIRFWDVATGKEKATTHGPPVQALYPAFAPVAFSPDGRTLATVSKKPIDKIFPVFQVVLWNVADGAVIAAWETEEEVRQLWFSSDGQLLIGRWDDNWIRWDTKMKLLCWNMIDLAPVPPAAPSTFMRITPATSRDQKFCAFAEIDEVILWDLPQGKKRTKFSVTDSVWSEGAIQFSPDSQTLAVGFSATQYDDWLGRVSGGMFPGSQRIAAFPPCHGVKLLDLETGRVYATFEGAHSGEFSPDSKMWAMHATDGSIAIWDVPAKKGYWPIILWSLSGMLALAIMYSWLRRARQAQDHVVPPSHCDPV